MTTVGYGNSPPESTPGRWNAVIFMTAGIAFLGNLISVVFDMKINSAEKRRLGMCQSLIKDGYIVVNFPGANELGELLRQWRCQEPNVGVVVVDESIESLPSVLLARHENLDFIRGSINSPQVRVNSNLATNKHVIVFPKNPHSGDSDVLSVGLVDIIAHNTPKTVGIIVKSVN